MATPLINPLRVQGGTFYTFSSAVKDIQKTFSDDDARFVFSKFALLDIPDVATPSLNYEKRATLFFSDFFVYHRVFKSAKLLLSW